MYDGILLTENEDVQTGILDVGDTPMETLLRSDRPALVRTMRRVITELIWPADNYSAHGSTPAR